jgi:hypothetical protein
VNDPTPPDPHGLLATGAELATEPELARTLAISRKDLQAVVLRMDYSSIRYVDARPRLYAIEDVRQALVRRRPELEARRLRAAQRQAGEVEAARVLREAREAAHADHVARKAAPRSSRRGAPARAPETAPVTRVTGEPEVYVARRSSRPPPRP